MNQERLAVDASTSVEDCVALTKEWVEANVPVAWRDAAARGGNAAIREVRGRADYEAWYPVFGASGLVMPTWAPEYGGLGVAPETATAMRAVLTPFNLRALNPLGLNNTAAALFAYGTEEQKRRFLGPIVRNEEKWCQLFSEPGAGSDLASLATRAVLDGDEWTITGQKVWTTWGSDADFAILLARTDPSLAKNKGITYFLIDMHQPGVDVRALRHISGEVEFNEVFLDQARVPEFQRLGDVNDGWRVANATLSSERQMVAGAGSGGSGRVGGSGVDRLLKLARERGIAGEPHVRQRLAALWIEERIRAWTNQRVASNLAAGQTPGPAASIGKVHQAGLNQRVQAAAVDLLGAGAMAWDVDGVNDQHDSDAYHDSLPFEVGGMLRSRANTIEGGTTEVNKNILGERVLGLPREPDAWLGKPWSDVPRSCRGRQERSGGAELRRDRPVGGARRGPGAAIPRRRLVGH
jgi:alkylation response protein AidB-like acyl-CoA dehydrogenase